MDVPEFISGFLHGGALPRQSSHSMLSLRFARYGFCFFCLNIERRNCTLRQFLRGTIDLE